MIAAMPLLRPARPAEYLSTPDDRYVVGRCWLTFCARDSVTGFVLWGSPRLDDANALVELLPAEGSPLTKRRSRLIDVRRLVAVEQPALARLAGHFAHNAQKLSGAVDRAAVVHAGGLGLALASGFASLSSLPYDMSLFDDVVAALAWLGAKTKLAAELDTLQASALGTTPLVLEVRAHIAANLRDAALPTTATALGMSTRSLQRKLHDADTSFQAELDIVRVDVAKQLLESDAPLATIARDVGCASPQHFGTLFRRITGKTPRQWRTEPR